MNGNNTHELSDLTLKELFDHADEIGNKYQTEEEISEYQKRLKKSSR